MKLAVVSAVVALAGCTVHGGSGNAPGALTNAELGWVRAYVGWSRTFQAGALERGNAVVERRVARCAATLEGRVGAPPTRRLLPAARAARRACAQWERYGRLVHRFYDLNDFSVGIAMSAAETRANEAEMTVLDRIDAVMWESRRLPRIDAASDRSRHQPRYTRVAKHLTSRRLDVRCWDTDDWKRVQREAAAFEDVASVDVDGFANFYSGHVNLSAEVCSGLDDLAYRGRRPEDGDALERVAYGVFVLAHETDHVAGVDSEAVATCDGMQNIATLARVLGADAPYGRKLANAYWHDLYPQEPPEYTTLACGPERPLDRSPGDGVWP